MRETIFGALRDSVLLRVGVVSAPLATVLAVFAIGLPDHCRAGQGTGDCPPAIISSETPVQPNVQTASTEALLPATEFGPPAEKPLPVVAEAAPLPAAEPDRAAMAGQMLAGTFVELQPALAELAQGLASSGQSTIAMTSPATGSPAASLPGPSPANSLPANSSPANLAPAVAPPRATALATAAPVVPAGVMSYSGQPGAPAPVVETPPAVAAMARATEVAALPPASVDIAPVVPLAPPDRTEAAEAPSDLRIVGGQGVNVRAKPSMSGAKLFALASGEKVTVKQNQRGWLHVVDDQGRGGWAYSEFLRNP